MKMAVFLAGIPSSLAPCSPFFSRFLTPLPFQPFPMYARLQWKEHVYLKSIYLYIRLNFEFINTFRCSEDLRFPNNT